MMLRRSGTTPRELGCCLPSTTSPRPDPLLQQHQQRKNASHLVSVLVTLRVTPLDVADDHARKQVNSLAILRRRDLNDLGLSESQGERPLRRLSLSRLPVHACTTATSSARREAR
jgi:uncharacterized protein YjiS (DUF1127 family)